MVSRLSTSALRQQFAGHSFTTSRASSAAFLPPGFVAGSRAPCGNYVSMMYAESHGWHALMVRFNDAPIYKHSSAVSYPRGKSSSTVWPLWQYILNLLSRSASCTAYERRQTLTATHPLASCLLTTATLLPSSARLPFCGKSLEGS